MPTPKDAPTLDEQIANREARRSKLLAMSIQDDMTTDTKASARPVKHWDGDRGSFIVYEHDFTALQRERDALKAENRRLQTAIDEARRNAYIRGFQRGFDARLDAERNDYERIRCLAEAHAISYCEQFEDTHAALQAAEGER